jgi:protein-disulfide isomerase
VARSRDVRLLRWKLGALPVGLCLLALAVACGDKSTPAAPSAPLPNLEEMLADKVLGDRAAPITIIEYSSLTCPHCASFHTATLPQLKTTYIDPGKLKLVYRDFPLDAAAMSAAMVARCSGERYFEVIDLLYRAQSAWASNSDTKGALKGVVAQAGLTSGDVDACLANTELRNGILSIQNGGQTKYGVRATPTFVINEQQKLEGAWPFDTFDAILKALLP